MNESGNTDPTVKQDPVTPATPTGGAGQGQPPDDLIGKVLDSRFKLRLVLGEGGMGRVYLAEDLKLNGRRVAVKMMGGSLNADAEFRARFAREAILQANLPHPQIVQILDIGECPEGSYIVMEYSAGRSLSRIIKELGPRSPEQAIRLAEQVLQVLDFAHGQGVVHRDLKPSNILVEERAGKEQVKLLDFGIAKLLATHHDDEVQHTLTKAGFAYGTLGYMAPEQACGDLAVMDHRADLYAVGVILYEMLAGHVPAPPESRTHPVRYAMWVQQSPVPSLRDSHPELGIGEDLDAVLGRALDRHPENRYPSALAFIQDLRDIRDGAPPRTVRSVPVAGVRTSQEPATIRDAASKIPAPAGGSRGMLAAAGLALAALVLAGVFFVQHRDANQRADRLESAIQERFLGLLGTRVANLEEGIAGAKARIDKAIAEGDPEALMRTKAELETAKTENEELAKLRDKAVAVALTTQEQLSELQDEAKRAAETIAGLREEHRAGREAWDSERAKLEGELQAIRSTTHTASEQMEELKQAVEEKSRLKSALKVAEEDAAKLQIRFDALEREAAGLRDSLLDARRERDSHKASLDGANADLKRAQSEVARLQGQIAAKDQQIAGLTRGTSGTGGGVSPPPPPPASTYALEIFNRRRGAQLLVIQELVALDASGRESTLANPRDNISNRHSTTVQVPAGTVRLRITHAELDSSKRPRGIRTTEYAISPSSPEISIGDETR